MTTKRTRFDRRKKPVVTSEQVGAIDIASGTFPPVPTHKSPTAPWRLRRPIAPFVLYRLRTAEEDAARLEDEWFEYCMAEMERRGANEPLDPDHF